MSTKDLLDRLESLGVGLTTEGDRLRYRAPRGVLTPQLRTQIQERESDLLKLLREDGVWVHESAAAELNQVWKPEIGPFIHAHFPELRKKAESAFEERDRVWRAVLDGKAEVADFRQALSKWKNLCREQIETFELHAIRGLPGPTSGTSTRSLEASEECSLMAGARFGGQARRQPVALIRVPNQRLFSAGAAVVQ